MNAYKFVTLIVVSVLVAVLIASVLNSPAARVADSALAQVSPPLLNGGAGGDGGSNALRTAPGKNYLPIIFLNSATAGGAWLLAGNAGTNATSDFLGTTDKVTLTIRVSNTVAYRIVPAYDPGTPGFAPNIIGGSSANTIAPGVWGATISGGGVSGFPNMITGAGYYAAVGGGVANNASGSSATVGGGGANTAGNSYATVGGGYFNTANQQYATIGGGGFNTASNSYATVGGGLNNAASGIGAFIGGGGFDGSTTLGNQALGNASTIGGGLGNMTTVIGTYAIVGGGFQNTASSFIASVGGGGFNTASNLFVTVGGGHGNTASGQYATIPGGINNSATMTFTFAAGNQAQALHQGAFVWADSTNAPFASTGNDQFLIRANGGVGINSNVPSRTLDVNGTLGLFDNSTRTLYAGVATEANAQLINLGLNEDAINRFGGAYSSTLQGGMLRVDARGGQNLFQFLGRHAGSVSGVTTLVSLNITGTFSAVGGFSGQCVKTGDWNLNTASSGNSCNMDVAEGFAATELTAPGDLVALVTSKGVLSNAPTVRKSSNAYDELLIGIVSQNPGLVFDNGQTHLSGDNSQLITNDKTVVALVGRVQVKVSIQNGAINIGDPLTSSSQPGVAMKATQAGKIIGYAMESTTNDAMILALVQPGDYVPPAQLDALKHNAKYEARLSALEHATGAQSPSLLNTLLIGALLFGAFLVGRRGNKR